MRVLRDEPPPPAEILAVGGKSYAFGLRWTSAAAQSALSGEAEAAARAEGANYIALHRSFNQFGLATIRNVPGGIRGALYRPLAGAAAIADAAGAATLAAFPLEDGRWLVLAIDRKGFLPDGDAIVDDAADAKARIEALIRQSPTSWRRKFVPTEWGIPDSRSVSPKDLLVRARAPHLVSLWLLVHRRRIRNAMVSAAVAACALVGLLVRSLTEPAPVASVPFHPPKPVAAVWTPAGLAIDRCLSAFRDAQRYVAVPGWRLGKYSCQAGEAITLSFQRDLAGQISALLSTEPAAQLSDDGRSAVLALAFPGLSRVSAAAEFAPRQRYQLVGIDLAQRLNGAFMLQPARRAIPGEPPVAANQSWAAFTWTYQTQAPAIVWAGAIARLGAISLETLVFSPADNLWQLSGSIYASN
jgi:hypothetical protein